MKRLHLVLIGENQCAMDCIKIARDLGHEVVACLSNTDEIKKYCEEENIDCFKASAFTFVKSLTYDFCIALTDIAIPTDMHNWIGFYSTDTQDGRSCSELFSNYKINNNYWYMNIDGECKHILQPAMFNLDTSFYELLVDLSRETIQASDLYSSQTLQLDDFIHEFTEKCVSLNLDKKIALVGAFYAFIMKYFPYSKNEICLGIFADAAPKQLSLSKNIQWLLPIEQDNITWSSLSNYIFKELITISMQEGGLSCLSKNQSLVEITFSKRESDDVTRYMFQPSLFFACNISEAKISLTMFYQSEYHEFGLIQDMLANFQVFLSNLLLRHQDSIDNVKMMEVSSLPQFVAPSATDTVIHLFEKQVRLDPDAIAVVKNQVSYTYKDLEVAAQQIALALIKLKVQKEDYVLLSVDRSFEALAAIIGIMMSGSCYVPIATNLPSERIQAIQDITQAKIILSATMLHDILLQPKVSYEFNYVGVGSDSLAYLIFTSGSTGSPKGVAIEHGGLASRLVWLRDKLGIHKNDVILHHTNMGFDVSIEEIFLPLISGSTIVLAPNDIHENLDNLVRLIDSQKVTYAEFVPSLLNLVLDYYKYGCKSLRYVISGGEALSYDLLEKFYKLSSATLINLYGPTECTINATYYVCKENEKRMLRYVPIGRAVGNVALQVVDQNLNVLPIGGVGELCIIGSGLARGYLRTSPEIESCTITNRNQRCYKTGDLVRRINEEDVEFLGRIDRQVKIRGNRIELEEIEAVLMSFANVKQSAVLLSEHDDHKKQLIAFLSFNESDLSNKEEINILKVKEFCSNKLPSYMLPNNIVFLADLPLTTNGKISYAKLKELLNHKQYEVDFDINSLSTIEKEIHLAFSSILEQDITLDGNFFDYGGNSLTAIQVVANLANNNIDIDVIDIFQYPTVLSLAKYCTTKDWKSEPDSNIVAQTRSERIPLSFSQNRLWYLYQLDGEDTGAYNISMAFKLRGKLDISCLQGAIDSLISRYEILRTVFKSEDGKPWQEILPHTKYELVTQKIPSEAINETLLFEANSPFNFELGPLYRFNLFHIADSLHVLCVTMHNIITDGWSEGIVINEISKCYNALIQQAQIQLPSIAIQYADFAIWQRKHLTAETLKKKLEYWVDKLNGYTELALYHDISQSLPDQTPSFDVKFSIQAPGLVQKIKDLASIASTTPYAVLISAFNALWAYKTNQYDVVIGSGMSGRNDPKLDGVIGFFVNTVVLRNDLSGNPTFLELIDRVKKTCIEAHQYQDVPFEMIVDALQLEREPDKNPIFQILFILQKNDDEHNIFNLSGVTSEPISIGHKIATFDITFNIDMSGDQLSGEVQFNSKLFSRAAIEKLTRDYQRVLEVMVAMPGKPIQSLHLVSKEEQLLISSWNNTNLDFTAKKIHELFEEHVLAYPDREAVIYNGRHMSYKALNAKANQLSHYLCTQIAKPNPMIGICLERSIDYVIAVMAVLKVGGTFIPLDPDYPEERLQYYISHSGVDTIICNLRSYSKIKFPSSVKTYVLENIDLALHNQNNNNLGHVQNELCYCIYTSGSTGNPKGILIKHESVQNLLQSMRTNLQVGNTETWLSVTSISFDIFYLELFLPLTSGNTCVLADQESVQNIALFHKLVNACKPTIIQATPSFWNIYLSEFNNTLPNIKVLVGGEALTSNLADKLLKNFEEVWNVYGPTETTIWSTVKKISNSKNITIGKPLNNTKCYVLNEYLKPVPLNIPGELYIAGHGLSVGYINNNELTNQVFKKSPFERNNKYTRIYKTGDFVRYLDNGDLQYLTRKDQQVKIRGFRIELAEIEAHILRYPEVCEAIVLVNQIDRKKDSLVAFYSVRNQKPLHGTEIQVHITKFLPDYMLPNKWIQVDIIPKTNNGKIDRNKLQEMNSLHINISKSDFIAPESELDRKIIAIWQRVLEIDMTCISLDESFFMIGGHSLLIPQVVSSMNNELGSKITIRDFIQNPTVLRLKNLVIRTTEKSVALLG